METTIFPFCTIKLICDAKQFDKNKGTFEFVFDITVIQTISCIMIVFNMQNFSGTMENKKREKKKHWICSASEKYHEAIHSTHYTDDLYTPYLFHTFTDGCLPNKQFTSIMFDEQIATHKAQTLKNYVKCPKKN